MALAFSCLFLACLLRSWDFLRCLLANNPVTKQFATKQFALERSPHLQLSIRLGRNACQLPKLLGEVALITKAALQGNRSNG